VLRFGEPAREEESYGSSAIFIRATLDNSEFFESTGDEMQRRKGRQAVYTAIPGEEPRELHQPRMIESPDDMQKWNERVKKAEEEINEIAMGDKARIVKVPGRSHERHVWEALKSARTVSEVRRAYESSKIWLKSRQEFPSGGYHDWSWLPYPRALYEHADKFCLAKKDSRYPKRDMRPSGDFRRMEYLGRVMAGLSLFPPLSPSYSVDTLRKMKHSIECECWRCKAQIAPRFERTLVQFLIESLAERV
jgi:hypothetical protein